MNGKEWIACKDKSHAMSWLRWAGGCAVYNGRWYVRPRNCCHVYVSGRRVR